jgi:predicted nucleic acid-binding Zn ribbon protein
MTGRYGREWGGWYDEGKRARDPRRLGDAVGDVARGLGLPDPSTVAAVERVWPELVGEAIAGHSRPRSVRRGVLTVAVDSPAWATQLRYLEGDVVARLAVPLGPGVVTGIRVVLDTAG